MVSETVITAALRYIWVRASIGICLDHSFYIYGWISKWFGTIVLLNPSPNKPSFLRLCRTCVLKTLWEKGKLLVTSNFSFPCSVFYPFWKLYATCIIFEIVVRLSVNPFPHNDTFWHPWETSLLKTPWEKEKLLVTSNFSFSHSVFYPLG